MQPETRTRKSPGQTGLDRKANTACIPKHSTGADAVELILGRLDKVRKCGAGHIARCPAHEDRSASLSISAGHDGRVLLNCFAGCAAVDVVASLGLQLADLFVKKPTASMTFAERSALREHARQSQWRAALNVLDLEGLVVQIAARQMLERTPLETDDYRRLVLASNRISEAREVLNAR